MSDADADALKELGLPPPGTLLAGRYRIERLLGIGGMGSVLLARHELIGQPVALKLLNKDAVANAAAVQRFMNEAKAAAKIEGENVVRVFDVGVLPDGQPYICMEYLRGEDLGQRLERGGHVPYPDVCNALIDAIHALAQAHAMGIVHRDLKPSNLFLAEQPAGPPVLKVLDFGIAKMDDAASAVHATSTGTIMGTPAYMAPEQMRSSKTVDARADIWALGAIAYELITGRLPFPGESLGDILFAVVEKPPPLLHELVPAVPPALSHVVSSCLNRDMTKRYGNVAELAEALEPFASKNRGGSASAMRGVLESSHSGHHISHSHLPPAFDTAPTAAQLVEESRNRPATQSEWASAGGGAKQARNKQFVIGGGAALAAIVIGGLAIAFASKPSTGSATSDPAASVAASSTSVPPATASATMITATTASASATLDAGEATAAPSASAVASAKPASHGPTPAHPGTTKPAASTTTPATGKPAGLAASSGWGGI